MSLQEELKKRNIPDLLTMNDGAAVTAAKWEKRREELIKCLSENLYGVTPPAPKEIKVVSTGKDVSSKGHFGGKASTERYLISFDTPGGEYSFPFVIHMPKNVEKPPVILHISFFAESPNIYMPTEEILDNGFALVHFCYTDVTPDSTFDDFTQGLAGKFIGNRKREKNEWGLVGIWAYAASRIMDYLITRDDIDAERIGVAGHSRLGKTALWCKAQDPRFFIAFGNNSNYGGCGLIRGHKGEDIPDFFRLGSYNLFCERFKDFLDVPHDMLPYEQHFLMACQAPGLAYVSGATRDGGMDPVSEFLSCFAANPAYELIGNKGIMCEDKVPEVGETLDQGEIGFHIREGGHFFSRYDWKFFMNFYKKHI